MHPVVFSRDWFAQHQRTLLWLLHAPVIGRWFRWVLCIRKHDLGYRRRIARLYPHAYEVHNRDGSRTLDCRTHAKYAKRLYYAFQPLWWTLHAWDMVIANPFVPALNAGFDTLTAYPEPDPPTTAMDGYIATFQDPTLTWTNIRGAASGGSLGSGATGGWAFGFVASGRFTASTANQWEELRRAMFLFDTSSMGGAAVVSAATLSLATNATGKADDLGVTPDVDVYTVAPASNTSMAGTDFATFGTTSQTGSATTYASISGTDGVYNDFAFNATGRGNVATTGVSKFGTRNANYDVADAAPTWTSAQQSQWNVYFADQTGTSTDPKLVVTYTVPSHLPPRNYLRPRVFAPGRAR